MDEVTGADVDENDYFFFEGERVCEIERVLSSFSVFSRQEREILQARRIEWTKRIRRR